MTIRTVSIVTAVHAPAAGFLADAHASIAGQVLPPGWDWQWVVQQDGDDPGMSARLPADRRVSFGSVRACGPATARTMALSRATGEIVQVLDADDQLLPGALARVIAVLGSATGPAWTVARALDLLPDGSTGTPVDAPPAGPIPRGSLLRYWRDHGGRLSVHPATLAVHTQTLLALGGWMALPASEDTGLLLALDATADGCLIAEPGLLYRKWPGQLTAAASHTDAAERAARHAVIDGRARALAAIRGLG